MPIYEYQAVNIAGACEVCRERFEHFHRVAEPPLTACPKCGAPVAKLFSAPNVGASKSTFDSRAKTAGFHKLKRTGKGEYEKQY